MRNLSTFRWRRTTRGFSLIELLVAMTLGLILMAGMIAVFEGNRRSSELNSTMADLQESARFALDAIARDTRMSGFQGCVDVNSSAMEVMAKSLTMNFRTTATTGSLIGSDGTWTPAHPLGFNPPVSNPAIAGTHALVLQFGGAAMSSLTQQMQDSGTPSPSAPITVQGNMTIDTGDLAVIADCDIANLFRVTGVNRTATTTTLQHAASGNVSGALARAFGAPNLINQTTVSRFQSNTYYIGDTGLTNDSGDSIRALYQQSMPYGDASNPPVELIQGVENLRVAFGVRDGNTVRYVTPDDAAFTPAQLESVRIGLLMSSFDPIATQNDAKAYTLAGQRVTAKTATDPDDGNTHPGDRRFRLAFNTTIKLRNRRGVRP